MESVPLVRGVRRRPDFGPRQVLNPHQIKEGATLVLVDPDGEWEIKVIKKPHYVNGLWWLEIQFLEGSRKGQKHTLNLAECGVVPYPRFWHPKNHLLFTEIDVSRTWRAKRARERITIAFLLLLGGVALLVVGLTSKPPYFLLTGSGIGLTVLSLIIIAVSQVKKP